MGNRVQSRRAKEAKKTYTALFDYNKNRHDEVSVRKNDQLLMLDETKDGKYCLVKNLRTNLNGFINRGLILPSSSVELRPWYFGKCTRSAAESQLLNGDNYTGTFLIRESENGDSNYTLSVLYIEYNSKFVKHYKIVNESAKYYYLNKKKKFKNLSDLVEYYSNKEAALCCPLLTPCEKIIRKTRENLQIRPDEILIDKSSNQASRDVLRGVFRGTMPVAIKYSTTTGGTSVLNEIEILKELDHRSIVRLVGTCISTGYSANVFMCVEDIANCSLRDFLLNQHVDVRLQKCNILKISQQVCAAMSYLVKKFIIHRDICTRNVFIGSCYFVKLGNFSYAKHLDLNNQYLIKSSVKEDISLKWAAPEVLNEAEQSNYRIFSEKSEIWSFGVFLYELITSPLEPYKDIALEDLIDKLVNENYRLPEPKNEMNLFYQTILLKCWTKNSLLRPSFQEIDSLLFGYFDLYEPDYKFDASETRLKSVDFDVINDFNSDQINLGILVKSRTYTEIWIGNFCQENVLVAVKKFKLNKSNKCDADAQKQQAKKYHNEYEIMKHLNHPNLIRLWGKSATNASHYLILEYMRNGNLADFMASTAGMRLELSQILKIALDIANGMRYLEYVKIVHGDLAARNVLVGDYDPQSGKYSIKIADFELSHFLHDSDVKEISFKEKIEIATRWAAPELVLESENKNRMFSTKSDVYSFGMVLYELITRGCIPFKEIQQEELYQKVFVEKYQMKKPSMCTDEYYALMRSCWDYDPDKRPKFAKLHNILLNYEECFESTKQLNELRNFDSSSLKFLRSLFRLRVKKGKYEISH